MPHDRQVAARRIRAVVSRYVLLACVALTVGTAACSLTDVAAPGLTTINSLQSQVGAQTLRAGAIATFAQAYADQALISGVLADEFTGNSPIDRRIVPPDNNVSVPYPYDKLSNAHMDALPAIAALERFAPAPSWRVGELFAYVANIEVFFAENMCSGIPLGQIVKGVPAYGQTLSREQLLARAIIDFDSASAYSTESDSIQNLARVGRARALLDGGLANATIAAGVADSVTQGYVSAAHYGSSQSPYNDVFGFINIAQQYSVSDSEGINGLAFVGAADPRLPRDSIAPGIFGVVADSSMAAPIALATWIEARLISAEALLAAGDAPSWISRLNDIRADTAHTHVSGLIPLTDPGSQDARVSLMFRERAFWLFGTGHRLGDLRRLVRQYGRGVEQVFPTGAYRSGPQQYGTDVVFVPFGESNNPNFHGCVDKQP